MSTIKALQIAGQNKIPQLVINAGNARGLLATVQAPNALLQSLAQLIVFGDTITISQKPITFGNWNGFGYIDESPGGFGYVIVQLNTPTDGGSTAYPPGPFDGPPGSNGNPGSTDGTSCSDPVNVSNGNLYQHQVDLNISSRGPSIVFSRTYNSLSAATPGPLGFGWTHSYAMSIRDQQTSAIFTDSTGGVYTFAISGGSYVSPPGLDLALTKTAQGFTLRSKHGTVWQFNTKGVLQSITDRNQNAVTLGYTNGNLTTITDALNRVVTLRYDGTNRITEIQDFAGRKLLYVYDALGNLASFTDPVNNRTKYVYYTSSAFPHLLQTVTKPAGNSTSFEYYANREVARVSDSAGRNMRFFYLPLHNETMFIDPRGFTGSYYYNASGNVTRVVKADGTYKQYTFSTDLKVTSYTDEEGNTTSYAYDAVGNLTSATDALGHATKFTYDPTFNRVASITNPLGAATTFAYDNHGNLTEVVRPTGVQLHYVHDTFGRTVSITNGNGNTINITRDSSGNPVTAVDPTGNTADLKFDTLRRLIGVVDPLGGASSRSYDAMNRITKRTNQVGASTSFAYDPNGHITKMTNPKGSATNYSYDALDNLAQVKDAGGNSSQYSYATPDCGCSTNSDLITFQDAAGQALSYVYDFNERATQVTDPAGNVTTFGYNARGDLVRKTDANGNTIQYEYDAAGHLLKKVFPDGTLAQFTYDVNGKLLMAVNPATTVTFKYDQLNRVISTTDSRFGQTIQYTYDPHGHRTLMKDPEGGQTAYTYNTNGRLTKLKDPSGATISFSYDARNLRKALQYSNGITTSYTYDLARRVTEMKTTGSGPAFAYTYDTNGNPSKVTSLAGTDTFDFDELNRVASVKNSKGAVESYSYDGAGNRLSSVTSKYTYDSAGRLLSAYGITYTYDNNGNLIKRTGNKGVTTFGYDFENRLTAITFPNGTKAGYEYDALGRRIQKTVDGVVTNELYDGVRLLLELDQKGEMLSRYGYGPGIDHIVTMQRGAKTYFYHSDRLGSIASLTDSSGKVVCAYSYDSFGNASPCTSVTNAFTFAGREYDAESGLYYMRARYYDPQIGRFLTPDPLDLTGLLMVSQDRRSRMTLLPIAAARLSRRTANRLRFTPHQLNRYVYVANNPTGHRDSSGLRCDPQAGAIIGTGGGGGGWGWWNNDDDNNDSNVNGDDKSDSDSDSDTGDTGNADDGGPPTSDDEGINSGGGSNAGGNDPNGYRPPNEGGQPPEDPIVDSPSNPVQDPDISIDTTDVADLSEDAQELLENDEALEALGEAGEASDALYELWLLLLL